MLPLRTLGLLVGGVLSVAVVLSVVRTDPVQGMQSFRWRPLVLATDEEIGRYALQLAQQDGHLVVIGSPIVRFARRMTVEELEEAGLGRPIDRCEPPPRAYAVLQGEFDTSRSPGGSGRYVTAGAPIRFIGYLIDLSTGLALSTNASPDGGRFRAILNDPTLPNLPMPQADPPPPLPPSNRPTMDADPVCSGRPAFGISGLPNSGPNPLRP